MTLKGGPWLLDLVGGDGSSSYVEAAFQAWVWMPERRVWPLQKGLRHPRIQRALCALRADLQDQTASEPYKGIKLPIE